MQDGIISAVDEFLNSIYGILEKLMDDKPIGVEILYQHKGQCLAAWNIILQQVGKDNMEDAKRMVLDALVESQNRRNGILVDKIVGGVKNANTGQ